MEIIGNVVPDSVADNLAEFVVTPFPFETNSGYLDWLRWYRQNWASSFIYVGLYLAFIVLLQGWMKNREKFVLRKAMALWNFGLALFSIVGTVRTLPELVRLLSVDGGFHRSVCDARSQYSPMCITWVAWFGLSKLAELGDTIFLVLRKRPLTFLHVYHHCTALVYTWYLIGEFAQTGRWLATMNFFIHSIMYSYHAVQGLRWFKLPKTISVTITFLQIAQMEVGLVVNLHAFQSKGMGLKCDLGTDVIYSSFVIYSSYFLLFLVYFYNSYLRRSKKRI